MTWLGDLITPRVTDVQVDSHHHVMVKNFKIVYDLFGTHLFGIKLIYYVFINLSSKLWKLCLVYRQELEQWGGRALM